MTQNYNITVFNGNTHNGTSFTLLRNSIPIDISDCIITMQVRKTRDDIPVISLTTDIVSPATGGITITDGINGKFKIDQQIFNVSVPLIYLYDIKIKFPNEVIKTYISGTFEIIGDITR
jgi:hypothetical protein